LLFFKSEFLLQFVFPSHGLLREYGCSVTDNSFVQFIEALKVNTTLTDVYLNGNKLGNDGAKYIADVLKVNTTLKILDIDFVK